MQIGMGGQGSGNGGHHELNSLLAQKMLIESKINEISHFSGGTPQGMGVVGQQQLLTNNERTNLNMRPPTCPPIFSGHWHTNSMENTPTTIF
jgi:hypothetical protein